MNTNITPAIDLGKLSKQELLNHANFLQDSILQKERMLQEVNAKMANTCIYANLLANNLWELVDAYDADSLAKVEDHLKMLSETRKRNTQPQVH